MHFTRILLSIVFVLFASTALAESRDKVEVCHLSDEGEVNTISISENALDAHMAHGDVYVDEDGDCAFQLCLVEFYSAGLGQSTDEEYKVPVQYFPASGEVKQDPGYGYEVYSGRVSPVGYSIFRAGSYYTYTYDYPYNPFYDFVGSGMTFDDSGMFVGIWKRPDDRTDETSEWDEGTALAEYTFIPGDCSF